ncbi:MAG: DUF433 domain-containing protein [Acidobacteria bacterium]|nr:DUF433 domain-containing protein [Acidobacteriota bacterium]MCA1641177.1 DUF433 domain-containing protein [Acidobacteriota bacterium]
MSTVATTHIEIDDEGVAWIADTRVKVVEVAIDKLAHGSSPEEIHFQYPHLSLAQIHAALAYYYDHQAELDADIEKRRIDAEELAARASDEKLRGKLIASKKATGNQPSARTYRRRRGRDTWHWCLNCSTFPATDYEERRTSPLGEMCNECSAKERNGNCHP